MKIPNTHDKYFKEVFSKKKEAIAFLKGSLSKELVEKLDFKTLKVVKTSYIDEDLKENFSDLVYSCMFNGTKEILITLLIEHKSRPVDYPHLQLLKYLLKIWESDIKQKKKHLTPVIPLVFYHGKEKWNKKPLEKYFGTQEKELSAFVPGFDYLLTDLSNYTDEEIVKIYNEIYTRTALLLMKNIFDEHLLKKKVPFIFVGGKEMVNSETGEKFFTATLIYLFNNVEKEFKEITKDIKSITDKGGNIAMTIAMQLEQKGLKKGLKEGMLKGMQKGMQKGIIKTRKETVIKLFTKGNLSVEKIVDFLDLDKNFVVNTLKENGLLK